MCDNKNTVKGYLKYVVMDCPCKSAIVTALTILIGENGMDIRVQRF